MRESGSVESPAIVVICPSQTPLLREVLAGIEEEGVPYSTTALSVAVSPPQDAVVLAHHAAQRSPLDVGVGIDASGQVCVHHTKRPEADPIELSRTNVELGDARRFGHNAARVVVGVPLDLLSEDKSVG